MGDVAQVLKRKSREVYIPDVNEGRNQRREEYGTGVVEDRVSEERSLYICKLNCKVYRVIWRQHLASLGLWKPNRTF